MSESLIDVSLTLASVGRVSTSAEADILPQRNMLPEMRHYLPDNEKINAATKWLESHPLSEDERGDILAGTDDASAKMAVFQHMLGVRRASRLAKTQAWLDLINDKLFDPNVVGNVVNDPYWWLNLGGFLAKLQDSDTKFVQDLAKSHEDAKIVAARNAATDLAKAALPAEMAALASIPPHKRERLRKMMQALQDDLKKST